MNIEDGNENEFKDDQDNDIEDELQKMINEQKHSKSKQKKIIIIIILSILTLAIIACVVVLSIMIFQKDNKSINNELLIIEPKDKYNYCLIFLHGLNDKAERFKTFFESVYFSKKNSTKIIFIRAPIKNVTYKNLKNVGSWFDIYSFPLNSTSTYNFEDAKKSKDIITDIINKEVKLLNGNYSKIILGGHSQGACMSLYIGYTADYILGGIMSLCGIFFEEANIVGDKDRLNVLLFNGEIDVHMPLNYHNKTVEKISSFSGVEKKYYSNVNHFVNTSFTPLLLDIEAFLNKTQN